MSKLTRWMAKAVVRVVDRIKAIYEQINLHYLKGEFKHIGSNAIIEYPSHIMNPQCISIGNDFTGRAGLRLRAYTDFVGLKHTPEVTIGNNVHLAMDVVINCTHRIVLEDNVSIGVGSKLMDHMHGQPDFSDLKVKVMDRLLTSRGAVILRNNVMLGTGVVVLPGVEIGENSIVGSNSVVTKDIPPNSIAAGVPARILRTIELSKP